MALHFTALFVELIITSQAIFHWTGVFSLIESC